MSTSKKLSQEEQILTLRYNQENSTIQCPKCESEVLYYDDYCYNCGTSLKKSQKKKIEEIGNINKNLLLKYASVCLVNELISNPFLFLQKTSYITFYKPLMVDELLIHFKPITVYEVLDYILSESYIVMLEGNDKYESFFSKMNENDIISLLNRLNLSPASSKEETISILLNNLSEDLLESITSNDIFENRGSNFFEVTSKGVTFVKENTYCMLYDDIFYDFNLDYYEEKFGISRNINDLHNLLNESIDDVVKELKWQSYSDLLYKYAELYDYFNEEDKMLYYIFQHVICEFNPYDDNMIKSRIGINQHLKDKLIYALSNSNKTYDEFVDIIHKSYDDLRIPKNFISKEDAVLLIEELFLLNEFREINKHLYSIYGFDRIEEEMVFSNIDEQEKIINKLENIST